MDTDAYTQYIERRKGLLEVIAVYKKRIWWFFFWERCIDGVAALASLFALTMLASDQKGYAVVCMGIVAGCGIVRCVVDMPGRASDDADNKRGIERQLHIVDAAWREWIRVWEENSHSDNLTLPDA